MKDYLPLLASLLTALGGWEAVKYLLNRKSNRRVAEANAFKVERDALIEDYKRVQSEVDELKKQVAKLYREIDTLNLRLTNPNYVKKAPAVLVQETRDQITAKQNLLEKMKNELSLI